MDSQNYLGWSGLPRIADKHLFKRIVQGLLMIDNNHKRISLLVDANVLISQWDKEPREIFFFFQANKHFPHRKQPTLYP